MSVLFKADFLPLLNKDLKNRITITPILEASQIQQSSIDVRLGNEFIIFRKISFPAIDIKDQNMLRSEQMKYQERIRIDFKSQFVLHPNDLVLGSTFEYIGLPETIIADVLVKSTWGRLGLIIPTPTKVDPGFHGCVTLELFNAGDAPLILYPGIPIAQLVFQQSKSGAAYQGGYSCATGPQFPRLLTLSTENRFWFPKT